MKKVNPLTTLPVPQLIRQIAIPASIGFFFNTMYNVVDTWYASISNATFGQAALTFSFPAFMIILSVSSGLGTAANVLVSNALGEEDEDKAHIYIGQSIGLLVILGVAGTLAGIGLIPWLLQIQNATGQAFDIASEYLFVIVLGMISFLGVYLCNSILNAQGNTKSFRNALIIGFFLNFIFNSLFLFGGLGIPGWMVAGREVFWDLGFPSWGVSGIALSTVLIEFLSFIYLCYKVTKTEVFSRAWFRHIRPSAKIYGEFLKQGVPASFNMMTVALGILIIQAFIGPFGEDAVAAYGISTRIEQIALLPTIGLNIAAMSLIGQNNGAKKYDRVKEIYKKCLIYGCLIVVPMMFIVGFFAADLLQVFPNTSQETVNIGSYYLHIALWLFCGYVILFVTVSALQGLKRPLFAMVIGITRQIILPLIIWSICIYVLGLGLHSIWWGLFGIIWGAALVAIIYIRSILRQFPAQ